MARGARRRTAAKKKKWIKGAKASMKRRGTEGSFRAWCKKQGYSKVTAACIQKGLKSRSPSIRKKAALAKAFASARRKKKK